MIRKLLLTSAIVFEFLACGGTTNDSLNQVFNIANNAISSAGSQGFSYSSSSPMTLSVTMDSKCSIHGEPLDPNNNFAPLSSSDSSYAARFFYCLVKQPTGGEDSLQGAIALPKGLACMLNGKLHFNGQPETISGTLDSNCFSDSFLADAGNNVTF